MYKILCDICNKEIQRNYVDKRLKRSDKYGFEIEVMVAYKKTWNDGDLCLNCLMEIINKGEEVK